MLELKLLGKPEVLRDGVPVTASVAAKPKALLAYLAVVARPVARDVLANLLWGDSDQEAATASLRQTLATLRKLGLETWVEATRDAVRFNLDAPHMIDVREFERLEIRDWRLSAPLTISNLQSPISLYRGDFLEGFNLKDAPDFEEWVVTQREHYRELALRMLHHLSEAALRAGRYADGVDYARRTLSLDVWREEAHRLLMLCYARSGQRSAALAQFAECRRILDKELGVPPSAETVALYERIRAAAQSPRANLPKPVTPFVGREDELAKVMALLLQPNCRLLTVLGMGGVGKTRLALQVAAQCTDQFINGAWFVPLVSATAASLVSTLAQAIECPINTPAEPKAQLLNFLRHKEMLLVLDNAEAVLDGVALFDEILRTAPDVTLLVTSRERLDVPGEWVFDLAGLAVPPHGRDDAGYSAVQLFVHGAQRARASFALAQHDLPHVARVCRLVDGLPLGIEMAAAWVRSLDCAHIADEIRANLDFLATTMRGVPESQRSVRAVFDASFRRLTRAEQNAFAQLSVFCAGFGEDAAAAVWGQPARALLTSLQDKSLVRRDATGRYDLHELVRQYAHSHLAGEAATLARHAAYFAQFLAAQQPLIRTRREREAMQAMRREADNLRQMWHTATQLAQADWFDRALISLYYLYEVAGWYDEGIALFGLAAACLDGKRESDAVRARLITRRASLARSVGRLDEAEAWFTEGLVLARAAGDESNQAYALRQLGYFPMLRGDVPAALENMEEALRRYRALNDLPRIADSLMSIGICKLRLGQMPQAAAFYQEAADIMTEVGDEVGCAMAYDNLGDAAYFSGEYEQAMRHYTAAAAIQRRYDEHRQLAVSQNNAAEVLCKLRRWDEALATAQESVTLFREMDSRDGLMHAMNSEAHAWLGLGEVGRASEVFGEVLLLGEQLHADTELLSMLVLGGRLLAARGQVEEAARVLYAVQHNPASPSFTVDEATAELGALPAEVVAQAEAAPVWSWVAAVANTRKWLAY